MFGKSQSWFDQERVRVAVLVRRQGVKTMRRQRQTALDYDRAALDAMAEPVPVAITDRDEGCLRGPVSKAVVEIIRHPFDILSAHQRYATEYRRVVAARREMEAGR